MTQWFEEDARVVSEVHRQNALARQNQLTKPAGSLGVLEHCAVQLAALQQRDQPTAEKISVRIFAADHGVASEGVSLFPQAVTAEMVRNFSAGGAAITVLARELSADFQVINVGTVGVLENLAAVVDKRIGAGTANLRVAPAMSPDECARALAVGRDAVNALTPTDIFIGGEMGIANTTSASALACALLNLPPQDLVGRGTGVDDAGVALKATVIGDALQLHRAHLNAPLQVLQYLGGFEIAALAGAYIRCAQRGIPVLVDGFICTAAALVAAQLNESVRAWLLFSHASAERGHRLLIEHLDVRPLLNLDMRLGEGSGAAVAVPLLRMACALHNQMASFESAGVSRE
ncbi:MAG: Nicotinate-nucleotide--dimethylbenzimidazole phosphoribosyltransferase [Verrucomicrobiaceae bacterium]|nr:Nicotinate-nucleotide--dimethylbenzimidazole phosphoribosyltransferase [Verrucomicrobiaceae bacterium]